MTLRLDDVSVIGLAYLAENMREDEKDQFCALTGADVYDADDCARALVELQGIRFALIGDDNMPIIAGGFYETRPMVWQGWLAGTQAGWDKHWRTITKTCRKVMDNLLLSDRCHRVEIVALSSRTKAGSWYMKGLGYKFEGVQRSLFADGRDGATYARITGDLQ